VKCKIWKETSDQRGPTKKEKLHAKFLEHTNLDFVLKQKAKKKES